MAFMVNKRIDAVRLVRAGLERMGAPCAVCFGDPQDLQTKAQNMAILTMLVILAVVLGGVGLWMRDLKNRIHRIKE